MMRRPSICDSCIHLDRHTRVPDIQAPRCNAFPTAIPDTIWFGGQDHRDPIDDEEITYDMEPGRDNRLALYLEEKQRADLNL